LRFELAALDAQFEFAQRDFERTADVWSGSHFEVAIDSKVTTGKAHSVDGGGSVVLQAIDKIANGRVQFSKTALMPTGDYMADSPGNGSGRFRRITAGVGDHDLERTGIVTIPCLGD
jgi:hypothetical protein